jgi:hypothetical protein
MYRRIEGRRVVDTTDARATEIADAATADTHPTKRSDPRRRGEYRCSSQWLRGRALGLLGALIALIASEAVKPGPEGSEDAANLEDWLST